MLSRRNNVVTPQLPARAGIVGTQAPGLAGKGILHSRRGLRTLGLVCPARFPQLRWISRPAHHICNAGYMVIGGYMVYERSSIEASFSAGECVQQYDSGQGIMLRCPRWALDRTLDRSPTPARRRVPFPHGPAAEQASVSDRHVDPAVEIGPSHRCNSRRAILMGPHSPEAVSAPPGPERGVGLGAGGWAAALTRTRLSALHGGDCDKADTNEAR